MKRISPDYLEAHRVLHQTRDQQYELEKRLWTEAHPEATPEQYQKFIRELAKKLGV